MVIRRADFIRLFSAAIPLPNNKTIKLVSLITKDPSDENIKVVIKTAREALPDEMSVTTEIELIADAVGPVHPGIKAS